MNIGLILALVIVGAVGGLIFGAIYTLVKISLNERKSKREKEQGKIFELINETPIIISEKKEKPKEEIKQMQMPELIIPETRNYKEDLKNFHKANKELEKLKKKYEKGKISYEVLKNKFTEVQNQPYYKYILEKDYGKKN